MCASGNHYKPNHALTPNYATGMDLVHQGRLEEALAVLLAEPTTSPCYSLAIGNAVLVLRRLDRFQEAEQLCAYLSLVLDDHGCPHAPSWVQFIRDYGESLAGQNRYAESLAVFNMAGNKADELIAQFPDEAREIELQKAHAFNSWGAAHLHLGHAEIAVGIFFSARKIYDKYPDNTIGRAEVLTNYARALMETQDLTTAEFALLEALDIAKARDNQDQVLRIYNLLIEMGSTAVPVQQIDELMENSALFAEEEGRYSTAYVRRCLHAKVAATRGDVDTALDAIERAVRLESVLDTNDLNPARLRLLKAKLCSEKGSEPSHVIGILIEGSDLWYERIGRDGNTDDDWHFYIEMHDHFRFLSHLLLSLGRVEEALVSFEAGRALSHAIEVDRTFFDRVVRSNPFKGSTVETSLLQSVQSSLRPRECLLVVAVLPPSIVCFIVRVDEVRVVREEMPDDLEGRTALFDEIGALPGRLQERVGHRAIPWIIVTLAEKAADMVGQDTIRAIVPYSDLHDIPWRVLLRESGLEWEQIECGIEFGLFLRKEASTPWSANSCTALGHGVASDGSTTIDLRSEAKEFAALFEERGCLLHSCKAADLAICLAQPGVVLLSCHGIARLFGEKKELVLEMQDGDVVAEKAFPLHAKADLAILSACESGVYEMAWSDFPVGGATELLRRGVRFCIGARFRLNALFSARFFAFLAVRLACGEHPCIAFSKSYQEAESAGFDRWRDLACLELLGGP